LFSAQDAKKRDLHLWFAGLPRFEWSRERITAPLASTALIANVPKADVDLRKQMRMSERL
jgi:hypothetical protein